MPWRCRCRVCYVEHNSYLTYWWTSLCSRSTTEAINKQTKHLYHCVIWNIFINYRPRISRFSPVYHILIRCHGYEYVGLNQYFVLIIIDSIMYCIIIIIFYVLLLLPSVKLSSVSKFKYIELNIGFTIYEDFKNELWSVNFRFAAASWVFFFLCEK